VLEKEEEKRKHKEELEKEREKYEQLMAGKDETITILKENFDSVEALKDFNRKPRTVQKWGKSTPVFCFQTYHRI
jgi:hypothetical protein